MDGQRIVFPQMGCCEIEKFVLDDEPPPGSVLLRVRRTLVSPGTEMAVFTGRHSSFSRPDSTWPQFPFYPGYSAAAEVLAVGEGVTRVVPGDTVFAPTIHTSHAMMSESSVIVIGPDVDLEGAVFAELGAIAMHGVRSGCVTLGERVAVFGQGIIGLLALRLARISGATQIAAFDLSPARLEIARRWGADVTVIPDNAKKSATVIREMTGGDLADVVFEATGSPSVIADCLPCARTAGRVVLLGSPHGNLTLNFYENVHARNLRLIGVHISGSDHAATAADPWNHERNQRTVLALVGRGDIAVEDLITDRVVPGKMPEVYKRIADKPGETLGVVVDWENP